MKKIVHKIAVPLLSFVCIIPLLLTIMLILYAVFDRTSPQIYKVLRYAASNQTIVLGDVLKFDWDVAYCDSAFYGGVGLIKQKHNLEFTLKPKIHEEDDRVLFFKDGKLVKVLRMYFGSLDFRAGTDEELTPQTVFRVEWEDNKTSTGCLSLFPTGQPGKTS